ncbi:putative invertase inhibitor [Curcuma longa]|uniref:putative invertase inhibitor n=1 Tax=Curcuma longa TaxID=136217 RepID=UPI003D9ED477
MKKSSALSLLSLISAAVLLHCAAPASASLEETCKQLANENHNVDYNFCLTSLQAADGAPIASPKELAVIAAKLTQANATAALAKVERLLNGSTLDPTARFSINYCLGLYTETKAALSNVIEGLASGKDKSSVVKQIDTAASKPQSCDDLLYEGGNDYLMKPEDDDCSNLATIAHDLIVKFF